MGKLKINIEESGKTPLVKYFDTDKRLLLEGKLIPENPLLLFNQIETWLEDYDNSDQQELTIEFYLYYYNTSSHKRLNMLFKKINALDKNRNKVNILWKCDYGDEDNIEDGKDFKEGFNFPFEIVVVDDE